MPRELQPLLPAGIRIALRDVAARAGHAAAVSLLACASKAARAKADDAVLCASVRAARGAKLSALCGIISTAHVAAVIDQRPVRMALINLCAAADAPPAEAAALDDAYTDAAAQWRALAQMADAQVHAEPDMFQRAAMAARAVMQAPLGGPAADDESLLRQWRAARFTAWLKRLSNPGYESEDEGPGLLSEGDRSDGEDDALQPPQPEPDDAAMPGLM